MTNLANRCPPLFETAPPEWEREIQDAYLSVDDSLLWECRARGRPSPWYTWLKNGEPLRPQVSEGVDGNNWPALSGTFSH